MEETSRKEEQEENILGTEKIGKLILKFSIPSIISMVLTKYLLDGELDI